MERFLANYAVAWLWASEPVVNALNQMIDLMQAIAENSSAVDQVERKRAYFNCIVEMRKDCGLPVTSLNFDSYRFVSF